MHALVVHQSGVAERDPAAFDVYAYDATSYERRLIFRNSGNVFPVAVSPDGRHIALQQQLSGNPDEEEPGLLHETEYFWKQAHWLNSRFPNGKYNDVEGLCKVVSQTDIEAKDWSLSPGRYVGVDTSTDEDFDYEERLNEIHIELEGLNEEAIALARTISENYKELAI